MLSKIWNAIYIIGSVGGLIYLIINSASEQVQVYILSAIILAVIMAVVAKFKQPPKKD